MNNKTPKNHSLAHLENTPENEVALRLASGKRGRHSFDTSWGHVVTKIIDFLEDGQLNYTSYSGEKIPVFGVGQDLHTADGIRNVKAEILTFFDIGENDSESLVVDAWFQSRVGNIHHEKLKQHDQALLTTRRAAIKKIVEEEVVRGEENIPVPTVLVRVGNLADKDDALKRLIPNDLREEVLVISNCYSFWEDTLEEEKMEFTMSKKELTALVSSLIYLAIDGPDYARIEESTSKIKKRIMSLVQVSPDKVQSMMTKDHDIPGRKRTNLGKKLFPLDKR